MICYYSFNDVLISQHTLKTRDIQYTRQFCLEFLVFELICFLKTSVPKQKHFWYPAGSKYGVAKDEKSLNMNKTYQTNKLTLYDWNAYLFSILDQQQVLSMDTSGKHILCLFIGFIIQFACGANQMFLLRSRSLSRLGYKINSYVKSLGVLIYI